MEDEITNKEKDLINKSSEELLNIKTVEDEIIQKIIEDPITFSNQFKEAEIILANNKILFKKYKIRWEELNDLLLKKEDNTIYEI